MNVIVNTLPATPSEEVTCVRVEEQFDLDNFSRVKEQLKPVLRRVGPVVLDLRTARLDGFGLGALLSMQLKLELQGRRMFVVTSSPDFHQLLDASGAAQSLSLYSDLEQAVRLACAA